MVGHGRVADVYDDDSSWHITFGQEYFQLAIVTTTESRIYDNLKIHVQSPTAHTLVISKNLWTGSLQGTPQQQDEEFTTVLIGYL